MAIIVIGGHTRNIGKTSVVAGLITALPELGWTAMKITQFGHGVCSISGAACGCAVGEHAYAIQEERNRSGATDTSRFLVAGARRSFWVRTKQGQLGLAMPKLRRLLASEPYVIVESNSLLGFIRPDLYIVVLSFDHSDFKPSARKYLAKANAAVVIKGESSEPRWGEIGGDAIKKIPWYSVQPPQYVSPDLKEFVAASLNSSSLDAGCRIPNPD
jgi:hypothetical protein